MLPTILQSVPDTSELTGVAGWAVGLMEAVGAPGAAIAIAAENLFPPIPSEVILPLAGLTAAAGGFTLAEAIIWTTSGSVVGALLLYALGRVLGHERLSRIAAKMPLVRASDIDKTTAWFSKHGWKTVLFGRFLPIFRSLISIPAGIERMPVLLFLGLTAVGSAIWNTIFIMLGFTLGQNWHVIEPYMDWLQWLVVAAVIVVIAWWVTRRMLLNRREGKHLFHGE
ncbi:DedA family protein [Agrococcus jenensis]|uniref:Membrane protein DedA with SNARE-associated domain n=1 Tax=Agrococcus jenensis TaxID=46353 RepID=A0A3N2AWC3_9MICO|nr:DedA family protein [Agrococcus jenensis]ROR67260.1 membrane protein DedA with SNARE-associated domain [Agrococcus jenensis]